MAHLLGDDQVKGFEPLSEEYSFQPGPKHLDYKWRASLQDETQGKAGLWLMWKGNGRQEAHVHLFNLPQDFVRTSKVA